MFFFATSPVWVELTKKQPIETKAVESLKGIGQRLARFPLKTTEQLHIGRANSGRGRRTGDGDFAVDPRAAFLEDEEERG
jgi:hypothetical protein